MEAVLLVTLPFFALVLCGYLAARQRVLPEAAIPGLNAYVLYFALPCMLFRFGASMPFATLIDPGLIAIYAACALAIVVLTVVLTRRRVGLKNAAFGALVAAFPNSGFMGVPLLVALHGDAAAGPVIGTLLVDLFLTSTLCLALASAESHDPAQGSVAGSALRSLRAALGNPQPWAIALGALAAALSLRLPAPAAQFVKMLGDSASPVALFTIGAVLWRAGQHAHTRTAPVDYLPVALIKLIVHPLLVGAVGGCADRCIRSDGAGAGGGAAEREQRLVAGRALRRRQRPRRPDHHGLDGAGVRDLHPDRLGARGPRLIVSCSVARTLLD